MSSCLLPIDQYHWEQRKSQGEPLDVVALDAVRTRLMRDLGLSRILADLMILRGHTSSAAARSFLEGTLQEMANPMLMAGMDDAVTCLVDTLKTDGAILISCDFDCDGVTAGSLLLQFLRAVGARAELFVPDRLVNGYGLDEGAIIEAAARGVTTMISVDCGISAVHEAAVAKQLGLKLIVTDHHEPPEVLPVAHAIINPKLPTCDYPDKDLCGAGIALMLCIALRGALRQEDWFNPDRPEPDVHRLIDLVSLATIGDLVPLKGINRPLVRYGLNLLNRSPRPGLKALIKEAGIAKVGVGNTSFSLVPMLNAPGRVSHAGTVIDLLLTDDEEIATSIAADLGAVNRERQELEKQSTDIAERMIAAGLAADKAIVLIHPDFTQGVVGISASRLVERYHRPAVLLTWNKESRTAKGSARSIPGFHLVDALKECADLLVAYGGHEMAAGMTVHEDCFDEFITRFCAVADQRLTAQHLCPTLYHDLPLQVEQVHDGLVEEIGRITPCGIGCPTPNFLFTDCIASDVRVLKDQHLSFVLNQGRYQVKCIGFGLAKKLDLLLNNPINVLAQLQFNEWRDQRSIQMIIKDIKPTHPQGRLF